MMKDHKLCYFELNANIVALYYDLLKNDYVKDYQSALAAYYNTKTYKEFLINLEKPESILNSSFLKNFDEIYDKEIAKTLADVTSADLTANPDVKLKKFLLLMLQVLLVAKAVRVEKEKQI